MVETNPATSHGYLVLPHVMVQKIELVIEDEAGKGRASAGIHHICGRTIGWHTGQFSTSFVLSIDCRVCNDKLLNYLL